MYYALDELNSHWKEFSKEYDIPMYKIASISISEEHAIMWVEMIKSKKFRLCCLPAGMSGDKTLIIPAIFPANYK